MEFIDTHCHFYDEEFEKDIEEAIARALEASVIQFVLPAINKASYIPMLKVADILGERAFPCIGLHPTEVGENWEEEMSFVTEKLHERKFHAIGEIGIDKHWSTDFLKEQKEVFRRQIEIAAEEDLPIIIHARDATDEIFEVLDSVKGLPLKGVFHAYSGSYETYKRCLKYGDFKFGIGGVLTYKKAGIAEVMPRMSLSDIVLETDCPYLTPVPHRGERNESSYIPIIAGKISQLSSVPVEEIARITTRNARKLFNISE